MYLERFVMRNVEVCMYNALAFFLSMLRSNHFIFFMANAK